MPNSLIHETSPYLVQHAHNPVQWYPWGVEALNKAKAEHKLILVSIGYSACHWCHVMEHESFEDEAVAEIMNEHFVCIKIDREERPDIDQVYMLAVQLMTGAGGWPLNCICLPDQRPIYGGTYFKKEDWKKLLLNLASFWAEKPAEAEVYADKLTEGIRESEKIAFLSAQKTYTQEDLNEIYEPWASQFDWAEGGYARAPKFPLPNNWVFMLRYAKLMANEQAEAITHFTLQKMAFGGIYDQLGGGFARYSVDTYWQVPHFEKMLYDNAQLVSLYAEAYQQEPLELYREVVYETIEWLQREMSDSSGGFYSALDADSEGLEGKFYTFSKAEIDALLGDESTLFCAYYNLTEEGNWAEEHTNILCRKQSDANLAKAFNMRLEELQLRVKAAKQKVFQYREARIRPGLDDKILTAWNGLTIKALSDAYRVFNEDRFLEMALKNAHFFIKTMRASDGSLYRNYKGGNVSITAFLDDYALLIEALISLYETTFDEQWLHEARSLTDYVLAHFYDESNGMFFYTSSTGETLIARNYEIMDNVIPSANSVMAHNLAKLAKLYQNDLFSTLSTQLLRNVYPQIKNYGSAYSNWASLLLNEVFGVYEVVITGPESLRKRQEIDKFHIPNKILLGGNKGSLPLLQDKWGPQTRIFVCHNHTCQLPVTAVAEAITYIH
ncbi:MAG: thioredoxin domain-containing protein [Sphingobacteriaceae bacterium]